MTPALAALALLVPAASAAAPDLTLAGKIGLPQPVGVQALATFSDERGPRWDLDLLVEPSRYQQSLSAGGAFRPFHNAVTVGVRARWLQLHPPWSRGYVFALDNALGLGPEIGGRWTLLREERLYLSALLGGIFCPRLRTALPPLLTADLAVGWRIGGR